MPNTKLFMLLIALYLAQGLPAGFIAHALPTLLREQGVSLAVIGFLKLLALPWLLKFLWAPLVDRSISVHGAFLRRRWIVVTQSMTALFLIGLSFTIANPHIAFLSASIVMILLINTCAATQDIVTDGIAVSKTAEQNLGWVNSIQVGGYKVGMILGGSGLLLLSSFLSWQSLFVVMSAALMLLLFPLFWLNERKVEQERDHDALSTMNSSNTWFGSLRGFFSQDNIFPWLLVLLSYKLSDGLGSSMLKPMLVDLNWTKSEIGGLLLQSSVVGLVGAACGGMGYRFLGQYRGLALFAFLQALSVSAFYFISIDVLTPFQSRLLVCAEQFCDGLSTVALFAAMMSHCRTGHEGSDYTVQASMQIVLAGILGAVSGVLSQYLGYSMLYSLCAVMGVVTLTLVFNYQKKNITKNKRAV